MKIIKEEFDKSMFFDFLFLIVKIGYFNYLKREGKIHDRFRDISIFIKQI